MDKLNGKYKFKADVAGDGFIHSVTVWGAMHDDAVEEAKNKVPGCTDVRMVELVDVTAYDVRKAIYERACEIEKVRDSGEMTNKDAFDELVKYIETLGNK